MDQVVTCILNASAGSNRTAEAKELIARIAAEQRAEARVLISEDGSKLQSLAGEARALGGLVVACGGDGTIGTVAGALVDTDITLGVLPMGTRNHFAKDLGIPLNLEAAIRTLFTGRVVCVDVGEVNGRIFVNNSSIGFYPQLVRERDREQYQGWRRWKAAVQATAYVLQRSRTVHVEVDLGRGQRMPYATSFLFVGNNRYDVAGTTIGTRTLLDRGELWVCVAPHAGRIRLLGLGLQALLGKAAAADLDTFDTAQIWVRMRRRHIDVATDGEVNVMHTLLMYRIRPAALRVLVSAASWTVLRTRSRDGVDRAPAGESVGARDVHAARFLRCGGSPI